MRRVLNCIVALLVCAGTAWVQPYGATESGIQGEVWTSPRDRRSFYAELDRHGGPESARRVRVANGGFEFTNLPVGVYGIRIVDENGTMVAFQTVAVPTWSVPIEFTIAPLPFAVPSDPAVSVNELRRRTPKDALREARIAQRERKANHLESAITHLERALGIDPLFAEARNDLGADYLRGGRVSDAVTEFLRAEEQLPFSPVVQTNLAAAMLAQGSWADAEMRARRALARSPSSIAAAYLLAISLLRQARPTNEALDYARQAAGQIPSARLVAAELLEAQGKKSEAAGELQRYLGFKRTAGRAAVEDWLARRRRREETDTQPKE